jgi:hypothetical protein
MLYRMSKEFHPRGHLKTGQMRCNKCGVELIEGEYNECWYCGKVCNKCSYSCFEMNKHVR